MKLLSFATIRDGEFTPWAILAMGLAYYDDMRGFYLKLMIPLPGTKKARYIPQEGEIQQRRGVWICGARIVFNRRKTNIRLVCDVHPDRRDPKTFLRRTSNGG